MALEPTDEEKRQAPIRWRVLHGRRWALDRWVRLPVLDWAPTAVVVLGHLGLTASPWTWLSVGDVLPTEAAELVTWFGLLSQAFATVAGFLLTAMVFFYGMERGLRLQTADVVLGDDLARGWRTGIRSSSAALLIALIAAAAPAPWTRWLAEGLIVLVGLRVARLLRVLFDFLNLHISDAREPQIPTAAVSQPRSMKDHPK